MLSPTLRYRFLMTRGSNPTTRTLSNVIDLRTAREDLPDEKRASVDRVLEDLRQDLGETVTKTNAAQVLGVSTQALDKWIKKGLLSAVKGANGREQIPRDDLEELAETVNALRDLGQNRAVLAEALRRVAAEDKDFEREIDDELNESFEAIREGKLDKVTLPDGWDPED